MVCFATLGDLLDEEIDAGYIDTHIYIYTYLHICIYIYIHVISIYPKYP